MDNVISKFLKKNEFILFLNEIKMSDVLINTTKKIPEKIDNYTFTAKVVVIPIVPDNKIINYDINYYNSNGEPMFFLN